MSKCTGGPEFLAVRVSPGRVMFEIEGVSDEFAVRELELTRTKLTVETKIVRHYGQFKMF